MRTRKSARSGLVGLTAAALVTACLFGLTPAAEGQTQPTPVDAKTRVHWADGKALTTHGRDRLGASVKAYLSGRAVGRRAADTLRPTGPSWSERWRQPSPAMAAVRRRAAGRGQRRQGRLRRARPAGQPDREHRRGDRPARGAGQRAPTLGPPLSARSTRAVSRVGSPRRRSSGSRVPMSDGRLSEGYVVLTWDKDNQLYETLVAGNGSVVRSESAHRVATATTSSRRTRTRRRRR